MRKWLLDAKAAPLYELLRTRNGVLREYVDPTALEGLLDRHQRGVEDATDRIWRLLNFQIWGEIFLGGKDPREVSLFSPAATQVA